MRQERDVGYIYMISNDNGDKYIGSTYKFNVRILDHKYNCGAVNNRKYNYRIYKKIREGGGWDNYNKRIIDVYDNITARDLCKIEQDYINKFDCNMNSVNSFNPVSV